MDIDKLKQLREQRLKEKRAYLKPQGAETAFGRPESQTDASTTKPMPAKPESTTVPTDLPEEFKFPSPDSKTHNIDEECKEIGEKVINLVKDNDFSGALAILNRFHENCMKWYADDPALLEGKIEYTYQYWKIYIEIFVNNTDPQKFDRQSYKGLDCSIEEAIIELSINNKFDTYDKSTEYLYEIFTHSDKLLNDEHPSEVAITHDSEEENAPAEAVASFGCALITMGIAFIVMLIWYFVGDIDGWMVWGIPLIVGVVTFIRFLLQK